ncbi:DUF6233 domain-containing protein [Streptomyces sp. NPDC127595]|uniref:DUF6233 domain-containing protein n=1 Tax=Streptomyces sp. NPDC127595 TaxID=3345405 RepID=UPI003641E0BF
MDRDEARRLLTTGGVPACPFCHPDTQLRIIDLAVRRGRCGGASNGRTIWPVISPTGRLAMIA